MLPGYWWEKLGGGGEGLCCNLPCSIKNKCRQLKIIIISGSLITLTEYFQKILQVIMLQMSTFYNNQQRGNQWNMCAEIAKKHKKMFTEQETETKENDFFPGFSERTRIERRIYSILSIYYWLLVWMVLFGFFVLFCF